MGYYGSQRQGDTIHSPLNCLPGAGWEPVSEGRLQIVERRRRRPGHHDQSLRHSKRPRSERRLYWYHGRGRVVASEYWSRALLIRDAMVTNRTNGSLVRVIVPVASRME